MTTRPNAAAANGLSAVRSSVAGVRERTERSTRAAKAVAEMIGDRRVTCFVFGNKGNKVRGDCFIGETKLEIEMVRNGWALAHHEGMEAWEAIARENKRGLWRGTFVAPERWRKGERLPGE